MTLALSSKPILTRKLKPYQMAALAAMPTKCEYCKKPLHMTKVDLCCRNEDCPGPKFKMLKHFFEVIKIDGLGPGELEKMVDAGFDTIPKIIRITQIQLQRLDKVGATKAGKLSKGLNNCLAGVKLARLMHASAMFQDENSGLGSTKLQMIIDHFGTQKILSPNLKINAEFKAEIMGIHGMGENGADMFADNLPDFAKLYGQIQNVVKLGDGKFDSEKLVGEGFCFTGFRDKDLAAKIEANGGKVTGGVTGSTTVLFAAKSSTKTEAAEKKGVKIVGAAEAEKYIERLLK